MENKIGSLDAFSVILKRRRGVTRAYVRWLGMTSRLDTERGQRLMAAMEQSTFTFHVGEFPPEERSVRS